MEKFNTILWDVDGTLLNFKKSERYALFFCFEKFSLDANEDVLENYSRINECYWKKFERNEIDKSTLMFGRFQELFDRLNITGVNPEDFQAEYQTALGSVYYYMDNSYELCKLLHTKYKQYIVTNGVSHTQQNKLHLAGLDKLMDGIFISEEIGYPKPRKEFFDACFKKIPGFRQNKTLIVGDSLTSDIQGGLNADITTCWYNPDGLSNSSGIKADLEIKKLQDIINYME